MFSYMKRGRAFYRGVAALALPIIAQNLVTTSLGLVDTFMVGVLGEAPLAAVAQANIPVFVMQLVIFGLQSGSSVLISQFWGKRDTDSINRVIGVCCYAAGAVSLLFAAVMFAFPVPLMGLLTDNDQLIPLAARYARIVGPSYLFNSLTGVYVGAHRSMENPKLGFLIFSVSMCVNTFLNWVLIFGHLGAPALGVEGAAWATFTSRVVEFCIMALYALLNRRFRLRFSLLLHPGGALVGKFLRYSSPVVLNETLWGLGTSLYKVIMGHMDGSTEILAARALAGSIEDICSVAIFAVAGTAAILIGTEIGSGRRDTVYDTGKIMVTLSFLSGLFIGGFMAVSAWTWLPAAVYPLFGLSPAASYIASLMLTFTGAVLGPRAFDTTNIVGVLRGGGDVRAAAMIDIGPLWLCAIPLAALFGLGLRWGIFWVLVAMASETAVKCGIGIRRFRSRAWINDVTQLSAS